MSIIISEKGSGTIRLEPKGIPKETFLQKYVQDHPEVLPMNEIRDDIQLFVVAKEFSTGSGSIDVLALDQSGEIYIIETKLYKNPDKRTVVAQALDYGASLWRQYATGSQLVDDLRDSARRLTGGSLEEHLEESMGADEDALQGILEAAAENLEDGTFHFVILMDRMDDRLKDLIAYVNENSRFSVYGVELDFYEHNELEIVIPRLYGAEVRKEVGRASERRSWSEAEFFEDLKERLSREQVEPIRRLYHFAAENADELVWGTGKQTGSFSPKFHHISPRTVFTVWSNGRFSLNFGNLRDESSEDVKDRLWITATEELNFPLGPGDQDSSRSVKPGEWMERTGDLLELLKETLGRGN